MEQADQSQSRRTESNSAATSPSPKFVRKKTKRALSLTSYQGKDRRSHHKRRKEIRYILPEQGLPCSLCVGGNEIETSLVELSDQGGVLESDKVLSVGAIVPLILWVGKKIVEIGAKITHIYPKGNGTRVYQYRLMFDDCLPEQFIVATKLLSKPDRRQSHDIYADARRFFQRVQVWKTDEFYHYHRDDVANEAVKRVDFTSNDYMALSRDPRILKAAAQAIKDCGLGTAGPSIFAGNRPLHEELSNAIASLKGMESCLLCPSGFTANSGLFTGLIQKPGTFIFLDEKDHASIYHGAMASGGKIKVFRHNDMKDLERKLNAYENSTSKIICVDGVYSMDGDLAPLDVIYVLAKKYNASLWVDDAHSFGVFGENGSGIESHFGLRGKIDIVTGSLSKALGCFGGFVCASQAVTKFLDHLGREFVYTTTLPATICAGALEGIRIFSTEGDVQRRKLWENVAYLREGFLERGFPIGPTTTPIIPIIFGHETVTQQFAQELYKRGVFVNSVTRPAVKRDQARIRLGIRTEHTRAQLEYALQQCQVVAHSMGLHFDQRS